MRKRRSQKGLVAGVLDCMLIVVITVAVIGLILNCGLIVYWKLKLSQWNMVVLDHAVDIAYRVKDFGNNGQAKGDVSTFGNAFFANETINQPIHLVKMDIDTSKTLGDQDNTPVIKIDTTASVKLMYPFPTVNVSDTEVRIFPKVVSFLGFQCSDDGSQTAGHNDPVWNSIAWVPIIAAPRADGDMPAVSWFLQSPRITQLPVAPDHHEPPCNTVPGYWITIVIPGKPPRSIPKWIPPVHTCGYDDMHGFCYAAEDGLTSVGPTDSMWSAKGGRKAAPIDWALEYRY